TFTGTLKEGWFEIGNDNVSLSLHMDCKALPKYNGKPLDLKPKMLFASPFMHAEHGSGIVTIQKGDRKMVIDFNKNTVTQQK
ncbi:MAG: hypothetical protein QF848_16000, partial [Planctomycetota bacterium]|nr:hypothetical protein [Planctomycetota bacterium]